MSSTAAERAKAAFLWACGLDVAVRKPGNVSLASEGHGMDAALFVASASAAAHALCAAGERVGARIESAMAATWAVAGCNTNLGILLLCAPVAAAVERCAGPLDARTLQRAIDAVLADLDQADAQAAYRAILQANPGGLGAAPEQDVHAPPSVTLRQAMALAADRDRIARQYTEGFSGLFELALPALPRCMPPMPDPRSVDAVQCLYLTLLAAWPDSHIVRKRGEAVAHSVMRSAARWRDRFSSSKPPARRPDEDPEFATWDESLKAQGINPGTTADLTVATLMIFSLLSTAEQTGAP